MNMLPQISPNLLRAGLPERGKIKIGRKGKVKTSGNGKDFQQPQKLDYFLITTMHRGTDGNFDVDTEIQEKLRQKWADKDGKIRRIPVTLLFDDLHQNFQSRLQMYKGITLMCTGDGEQAIDKDKKQKSCPCDMLGKKNGCKANGVLSVMIRGADAIGGVWKLRTTGWSTISGIVSSLAFIKQITGGRLRGLDLEMFIAPKQSVVPGSDKVQTIYYVGLEYKGSIENLATAGYQLATTDVNHAKRIQVVEAEFKQISMGDFDESEDVAEEFFPDTVNEENEIEAAPEIATMTIEGAAPTETKPIVKKATPAKKPEETPPETGLEAAESQAMAEETPEAEPENVPEITGDGEGDLF